jgi:hypothetical protein
MLTVLAEQDIGVGADDQAATTDKGETPEPETDKATDKGVSPAAPASKAAPAAPAAPATPAAPASEAEVASRVGF